MVFSRVVPSLLPEPNRQSLLSMWVLQKVLDPRLEARVRKAVEEAGFPCVRTSPTGMLIPDLVCFVSWGFVSLEEVSAVALSLTTPWTNHCFQWYTFISCVLSVKDLANTSRNCWGEKTPI